MPKRKILLSDEQLVEMYDRMPTEAMGTALGVAGRSVRERLQRIGIDMNAGMRRHKRGKRVSPRTEFRSNRDASATEKACSVCSQLKPLSDFHIDRAAIDGRRHLCADCARAKRRADYRADPERYRTAKRRWYQENLEQARRASLDNQRKILYGITPEIFREMVTAQNGVCSICEQEPKRWSIDHDHKTGAIRGVICKTCNSGLGLFGDDPDRLLRAMEYLRK
jgi:hypothetical protein